MRYLWGILILGITILFHEFGHMVTARKNGVFVEEFSVGFGPRILSHKSRKSGTVYSWKIIPFGGSCAMRGETEEDEHAEGSFTGAKLWQKALIVAAGPLFNFLLALIAAFILAAALGQDPAVVAKVEAGSPAEAAGLEEGDEIIRFDGRTILNSRDLQINLMIYGVPTDNVRMTVRRNGEKVQISYVPETTTRWMLGFYYDDTETKNGVLVTTLEKDSALKDAGLENGDVITALNGDEIRSTEDLQSWLSENPLDGSPVDVTYRRGSRTKTAEHVVPRKEVRASGDFSFTGNYVKQNAAGVVKTACTETAYNIGLVWKTLGGLVSGIFSINDFSGPVGIVKTVGDTYQEAAQHISFAAALLTLVSILCMISANLGIMNLIPLPALDGGKLLIYLIEAVTGKHISMEVQYRTDVVGLGLLLVFSMYITIHDILRII